MPYVCRNKTVYFNGEEQGIVQDFLVIRKDLCSGKKLFEDDKFPAKDSSLYYSRKPKYEFEWKRPHEIVKDPRFIVDGTSRFDIRQGVLGDCWMLAGMANLTTQTSLQTFVIPSHQSFENDYAGIFHFRFWRQGRWIDVTIDDRLPTIDGRLAFVKSTVGREFWSALLEKAYAKMFGTYEAIEGGRTIESMVDLSGGVPEIYNLKTEKPKKLFEILQKADLQKAWLTCSIFGVAEKKNIEIREKYGLVTGHAYTLTAVKTVKSDNKDQRQKLVRVRNPWGEETEWKGAYSDNSEEWKHISDTERKKLNLETQFDGEFWMPFQDFMKHFSVVEICHLSGDHFSEKPDELGGNYIVTIHHGKWSAKDGTAGGNPKFKQTFKNNPQYRVTLKETDECLCENEPEDDDDDVDNSFEGNCTLIVSLMQKNRRKGKRDGVNSVPIAFYIFQIADPDNWPKKQLGNKFLSQNEPVYEGVGLTREISTRLRLEPGTYVIIPCTQDQDQEAEFMIRILTEKPVDCICTE